jgi:hypothetical protein
VVRRTPCWQSRFRALTGHDGHMKDDGTGVRRIDIASPRGRRYTVVTAAETVTVLLRRNGAIKAGRAPRPGGGGPRLNSDGKILPVEIFEFDVGEAGYVRWAEPDMWFGDGFASATVLSIAADQDD